MKKFLFVLLVAIIIVALYLLKHYQTTTDTQSACLHITTPTPNTTLHFPLTIAGTVDYGCWTIFEAVAGHAFIRQNGQDISDVNAINGQLTVNGDYYQESDYPVQVGGTIQNIDGNYSGPAELVIMPDSPCGDSPECPPQPDPIVIPVLLQ